MAETDQEKIRMFESYLMIGILPLIFVTRVVVAMLTCRLEVVTLMIASLLVPGQRY